MEQSGRVWRYESGNHNS